MTATDEAGNVNVASAALALKVDAITPDAPQAPELIPISTPGAVNKPPKISNVSVADPNDDGIITTETAPVLTGQALPGATITLYDTDGIAVLGTAVASAKGAWSITSNTLTDGLHTLTVTQTKAAGDVSPASTPLDLTVDTLPPQSPLITSLGGVITANAEHTSQVDVIGTAEPGSTVTLHVDMNNLVSGTGIADAEGDYVIDGTVAPGVHKLTVIATDAVGNASQPSTVVLVTVDNPAGTSITGTGIGGYIANGAVEALTPVAAGQGFSLLGGIYDVLQVNGVLVSTQTGMNGQFTLDGAQGALLALVGGTDISTGLTLPGELVAPASPAGTGPVVITPLTTFVDALMMAGGLDLADATSLADTALGFTNPAPLLTLDPIAQVTGGAYQYEIASAQLVDTATLIGRVFFTQAFVAGVAGMPTNAQAVAFDTTFMAIAQSVLAGTPIDLSSASYIASLVQAVATLIVPGFVAPAAALSAASAIIAAGNAVIAALPVPDTSSASEFTIDGAVTASAPGNDTTASSLQVYGSTIQDYADSAQLSVSIYADGNATAIGTTSFDLNAAAGNYVVTTTPLATGAHTLTAVETLVSGATVTSQPFKVTVTPAAPLPGLAEGTGSLVGAVVFEYAAAHEVSDSQRASGPFDDEYDSDSATTSAANGTYTLPTPVNQADVIGVYGGTDALTGLRLGGGTAELTTVNPVYAGGQLVPTLLAPSNASVIDALTTLVVEAAPNYQTILATYGTTTPALQTASSEQRVLAGLGLSGYDLLNTDPLALAEAGDPTLFLMEAKLLDTATLLSPINEFTFEPFIAYLAGTGYQAQLDLDDPASILKMLQDFEPYTLRVPTTILQAFETIVAASNAAIDAAVQTPSAQAAAGLPGLIADTVAAEKVAQTTEAALLASTEDQIAQIRKQQANGAITATDATASINAQLATAVAATTGSNLTNAITAEEAQAPQVTAFAAGANGATNAARVELTITFSQSVTGLTAQSFTLNETSGLIDAVIIGVAAVAGSNDTQYNVTVGTGAGNGQLSLSYSDAGLLNATSKPITIGAFAGTIY